MKLNQEQGKQQMEIIYHEIQQILSLHSIPTDKITFISTLKQFIDALIKRIKDLTYHSKRYKKDLARLTKESLLKLESLMKAQDDLISENDRLDILNKKLQSHIDTLRLENASFTKQIEEFQQRIDNESTKKEVITRDVQVIDHLQELSVLQSNISTISEANNQLQDKMNEFITKLNEKDEIISRLESKINERSITIKSNEIEKRKSIQVMNQIIESFQKQTDAQGKNIQDLLSENSQIKDK
jgi:DNA repair exonuclease SbcCD ATPase subunit